MPAPKSSSWWRACRFRSHRQRFEDVVPLLEQLEAARGSAWMTSERPSPFSTPAPLLSSLSGGSRSPGRGTSAGSGASPAKCTRDRSRSAWVRSALRLCTPPARNEHIADGSTAKSTYRETIHSRRKSCRSSSRSRPHGPRLPHTPARSSPISIATATSSGSPRSSIRP